jgi:hypothetical protein
MRRLVVSPAKPEELGRRFLGSMAYLEPKGEGDNSMHAIEAAVVLRRQRRRVVEPA